MSSRVCPACSAAVKLAAAALAGGKLNLKRRTCCGGALCPVHRQADAVWRMNFAWLVDKFGKARHADGCPNHEPTDVGPRRYVPDYPPPRSKP